MEVGTQWVEVPEALHGETSLFDLDVRAHTGATIVAIERDGNTIPNPDASYRICGGDRLLTVGVPEAIERLNELLAERETEL
jgi:K+/H+ antiporter YhaU regulatory subunit KhtT